MTNPNPNPNANLADVSTPADLADALGQARVALKEAKGRVEFLERLVKQGDLDLIEGHLFSVSVSRNVVTNRVKWQAVAERLNPSRQLITAHTSQSIADRVNVRAHSKGG